MSTPPNPGSASRPGAPGPNQGPSRRSKILGIIAGIAAVLFFVVPVVVGTYTDFAWFSSVDYRGVFMSVLGMRLVLFAVFAALGGLISWLGIFLAYRARPDEMQAIGSSSPLAEYRPMIRRNLRPFLVGVPIFVGAISGLIAQSAWRTAMMFLHGSNFGVQDPQFHKDLSFYAFNLPMLQLILSTFSVLLIVAFVLNAVAHYLLGSITTGNPRVGEKASVSTSARRQLVILAGLWMLLKAVDYWFDRYALMNRSQETFTGAGYTDINAVLPAKIVLTVIAVFVAAMFFVTVFLKDLRIPALAVALMLGSSLAVDLAWPAALEQFSVSPNRAEKEREYIARNIEATRYAYDIGDDKVTYQQNWAPKEGTKRSEIMESVADDSATISNIRLLDPEILSPTFTQQQQLKNFYGFPKELAVDRYEVDGQMRDFVVAARELNPNTLDGNQKDWINRHTVYTHGNGFIAAPARKVDEVARDVGSARGGYPVYTVADLQSMARGSERGDLKVDLEQPRIYFGPVIASSAQPNSDYAIVGTTSGEPVEYDTDDENYSYTGTGGVDVSNYFNRIMYSAQFESMKMLLTDRIGEGSKIVYERDPRERVHKVAPWLTTDSKTYPVVIDGRVKWIVDGYTTLDNLPYSQRTTLTDTTADATNPNGVNQNQVVTDSVGYIRNSVKAVVDSYDGTVDLYAFDEGDPVLKAWRGAFPDVVKPKAEISDELMRHFRYPEDMFKVQRELIAKYHVSDPAAFFTNDAFWSVPSDPTAPKERRELAQPPYYVVAANPQTGRSEYQLITPFRGLRREFLAAHLAVSSDPKSYGQMYVRVLPTGKQTLGPSQAQDAMMSSDEIARERTLLKGTNQVTNGNLLTLPVGDGQILYVEPVYSQRSGQDSAFPKLLRVLVYFDGKVGYAPTVSEALSQVGIDSESATKVKVVEDGVADAGRDAAESSGASDSAKDSGSASGGGAQSEGSGDSGDTTPEQRVRDAMDKVNSARNSGSYEEFGRALDELDRAVQQLQSGR